MWRPSSGTPAPSVISPSKAANVSSGDATATAGTDRTSATSADQRSRRRAAQQAGTGAGNGDMATSGSRWIGSERSAAHRTFARLSPPRSGCCHSLCLRTRFCWNPSGLPQQAAARHRPTGFLEKYLSSKLSGADAGGETGPSRVSSERMENRKAKGPSGHSSPWWKSGTSESAQSSSESRQESALDSVNRGGFPTKSPEKRAARSVACLSPRADRRTKNARAGVRAGRLSSDRAQPPNWRHPS